MIFTLKDSSVNMFSQTPEQSYLIDQNKQLNNQLKELNNQILEKDSELRDLEADNEKMDASIRYQRGLLSNFNALTKEKDSVIQQLRTVSSLHDPACTSPRKLKHYIYFYVALTTLVYQLANSGELLCVTFMLTWEFASYLIVYMAVLSLQDKLDVFSKKKNAAIKQLEDLTKKMQSTEKSNDYVQELIDNV